MNSPSNATTRRHRLSHQPTMTNYFGAFVNQWMSIVIVLKLRTIDNHATRRLRSYTSIEKGYERWPIKLLAMPMRRSHALYAA